MARYELLDNVTHKDLRVTMRFGAEFGDELGLVPAFPTEFAELQREYPIFLRKDEASGEFQAVALLGFHQAENLFLQGDRWAATYLPGAIARGPFLIGHQVSPGSGEAEPVVHVDLDHPRISPNGEGLAVFQPQGGRTPYLDQVLDVLRGINDGVAGGRKMFAAMDALQLIQPVTLDLRFDEQHGANLTGLHGIDRERLAALDAEQLHGLHRDGWLEGVYLMLSSLHNIRRLIGEKQRRLREQAGQAAA